MSMIKGLLSEQRKRVVAGILGHAESAVWWPRLSAAEQQGLRSQVLSSVNAMHDVTLDLLKVATGDGGVLISEDAVRLIQDTYDRTRSLERLLVEEG